MRYWSALIVAFGLLLLSSRDATWADESPQSGPDTCPHFAFTLRLDFNNVGFFKCDKASLVEAEGAQFSATFDELAHHTSVSGDGITALIVREQGGNDGIIGVVFGPYIQADGSYQFKSQSSPFKETGTLIEGGFVQVQYNPPGTADNEYFRLRGGPEQSSSGIDTTTIVGEWLPTTSPLSAIPLGEPKDVGHVTFVLSPELMFQYDQLSEGPRKFLLFSSGDSAFRIGPQISLWLYPKTCTPTAPEPRRCDGYDYPSEDSFWGRVSVNFIGHISDDTASGRQYAWGLATLNFTVTPNFGLSASYGIGNSEATANRTSQIKLGLSAKF